MKTINRIAKKSRAYLATLALGTALVSSMGYQNAPADEYLPITESTRTAIVESVRKEISEAEREYTNALTTARSDFNSALVKRNFTLDAQRQVYTNLAKARSLNEKILASYRLNYKGSLESEDGRTFTALTEGDSRLYSLITNSLAGSSDNLETALELEGLNVNVERAPKLTNAPVLAKAAVTNTISYVNEASKTNTPRLAQQIEFLRKVNSASVSNYYTYEPETNNLTNPIKRKDITLTENVVIGGLAGLSITALITLFGKWTDYED